MSTKFTAKPSGPLAPQYVNFVYIPSAVLIAGAALIRVSLVPVAVAIAAVLGGYQFYANRMINTKACPSYSNG
jgi:cytochrome-b5 reductase